MPGHARVFSLDEVDHLIPDLNHRVAQLLLVKDAIDVDVAGLRKLLGAEPSRLEDQPGDSSFVLEKKDQLRERLRQYERGWADIEDLGAIVKDTAIGLLDFYGRVDDRLVWLCWRYGEESLGYYHTLDSGYSGRRPLDRKQRALMVN